MAFMRDAADVVMPDAAVYPFTREDLPKSWADAPRPILVAEIRSPATCRRDVGRKRDLYVALGILEYWIVDADARTVAVVRPDRPDEVMSDVLRWHPAGASYPLEIDLAALMR